MEQGGSNKLCVLRILQTGRTVKSVRPGLVSAEVSPDGSSLSSPAPLSTCEDLSLEGSGSPGALWPQQLLVPFSSS